jgi:hypothetical protein
MEPYVFLRCWLMAANVTVKAVAFTDPRVELLGELAGYNRFEALGRMAHLWSVCTDLGQYIVSEAVVRGCLGVHGVDALLVSELGERSDDGIRIRGTVGSIEWLANKRKAGKKGGSAAANGSKSQSNLKQNRSRAEAEGKQRRSRTEASPNPQGSSLSNPGIQGSGNPKGGDAADKPPPPDFRRFTDSFNELYAEANGGAKPSWGSKQGNQVKQLIAQLGGTDEAIRRATNMFRHPPSWLEPPYDLGTLLAHADKFSQPHRSGDRAKERYYAVTGDEQYPDGEVKL